MARQDTRIVVAVLTYFSCTSASLAWMLQKAGPGQGDELGRGWSMPLYQALRLWNQGMPSELVVFVLFNFFISSLLLIAVLTTALFLGRLSVAESQRLSHRLVTYIIFKMVFVGSFISPDPRDIAIWLAWFAVMGYLRVFLGAAKDRLESLLVAPVSRLGRHLRGLGLLLLILVHNAVAFGTVARLLRGQSLARLMLCAFDCAVIAIEGAKTLLRYVVHMAERYRSLPPAFTPAIAPADPEGFTTAAAAAAAAGGGGGWCCKGSFLYHAELVADLLVHSVTLAHYTHVWMLHGLSFHFVDAVLFLDMRAVLISLFSRLRCYASYRAATHRLNTAFRDVHPSTTTPSGLPAAPLDCTICMDEINTVAKQLPCGHVFHLACLRAWLQQSGSESFTCPNCRQPILVDDGGQPPRGAAAAAGGGAGLVMGVGLHAGDADGDEEEGQEEEGGQRRRRRQRGLWGGGSGFGWRLVAALDRAYVRLVVMVEPLLLTLLLRMALWLGRHAESRRRGAGERPQHPPHQPQQEAGGLGPLWEGFGESPGPRTLRDGPPAHRSNSQSYGGGGFTTEEEESEEEVASGSRGVSYESDIDNGSCGWEEWCGGDGGGVGEGVERLGECGRQRHDLPQPLWRLSGSAAAARAARGCGAHTSRLAARRPTPSSPSTTAVADHRDDCPLAARAAPAHADSTHHRRRRHQHHDSPCSHPQCTCEGVAGDEAAAGPSRVHGVEVEQEEGGAMGGVRRGLRLPRREQLRLPPPAAEVPCYSGEVLARGAAAVATQLGRAVSVSLRTSWGAGGVCAGAVAGAASDDDGTEGEEGQHEATSRRRRAPRVARVSRSGHRQQAAAAAVTAVGAARREQGGPARRRHD